MIPENWQETWVRLRSKANQNCFANIGKAWSLVSEHDVTIKTSLFKKLFIRLQLTIGHRGNSSEHARSCRHQLFPLFALCAEKFTSGEILGGQMKKNACDGMLPLGYQECPNVQRCLEWILRGLNEDIDKFTSIAKSLLTVKIKWHQGQAWSKHNALWCWENSTCRNSDWHVIVQRP